MLITGVTFATGMATYVTRSYKHKMVVRVLDRALLEQVGDRAVERRGLLSFISWFPNLCVVDRLLDRALSSELEVRCQKAGCQHSSYGSLVINLLMYCRGVRNLRSSGVIRGTYMSIH